MKVMIQNKKTLLDLSWLVMKGDHLGGVQLITGSSNMAFSQHGPFPPFRLFHPPEHFFRSHPSHPMQDGVMQHPPLSRLEKF